jgi:hypothetical protein
MSEDAITDRIKEVIRNYEAAILGKLNAANEAGKEEIRDYVETFIRNLSIEFPIAIKDILDRGGSVRQVISTTTDFAFDNDEWIQIHGKEWHETQHSSMFPKIKFQEIVPGTKCRVTIIVEPISKKGD